MIWHVVIAVVGVAVVVEGVLLVAMARQLGLVLLNGGGGGPAVPTPFPLGPPQGSVRSIPGLQRAVPRPTLVVFTSSGCPGCKAMMPRLLRMFEDYGPDAVSGHQVDFVAVVIDREGPIREEYARELGPFARTDLVALMMEWGVPGAPFAVALDAEDRVAAADGVSSPDVLETFVVDVLGANVVLPPAGWDETTQDGGLVVMPASNPNSN